MKVLVVAKAPVAGQVKTRLGAVVGDAAAAELAAASLLDTLDACSRTGAEGHLSLAGDLDEAVSGDAIRDALAGWTVHRQRGDGFAERLVNAHADAGTGPLVQIGMDTPHVTPAALEAVAALLADHDTVLAPASDGGWWALGRQDPAVVRGLVDVPMSTGTTCADTRAALERAGCSVGLGAELSDVDTVADAERVAALAPHTRFARLWLDVHVGGTR